MDLLYLLTNICSTTHQDENLVVNLLYRFILFMNDNLTRSSEDALLWSNIYEFLSDGASSHLVESMDTWVTANNHNPDRTRSFQ